MKKPKEKLIMKLFNLIKERIDVRQLTKREAELYEQLAKEGM